MIEFFDKTFGTFCASFLLRPASPRTASPALNQPADEESFENTTAPEAGNFCQNNRIRLALSLIEGFQVKGEAFFYLLLEKIRAVNPIPCEFKHIMTPDPPEFRVWK